jgi:hypothetical protein
MAKGERITKEHFEKLRNKYDKNNPGKTKSVTFDKATFERVIGDPETVDVAVFMGEEDDEKSTNTVMIVGLDKKGKILYQTAENKGSACPPYCPIS